MIITRHGTLPCPFGVSITEAGASLAMDRAADDKRAESVDIQVSIALLTVVEGSLLVAVQSIQECQLPSRQPARQESLDSVARSFLRQLVGSDASYFEQLYTFSFSLIDRSEIVVSYLALVAGAPDLDAETQWQSISGARDCLHGTDPTVLDYALVRLRAKIGYTTIAFHLMAESFALSDLHHLYETILDRPLDPRNFRRRIISSGLVQAENRTRRVGSHRPAALYRFAGSHDPASYLTPDYPQMGASEEREMLRNTK
jgi:8-oxo-dGTP diphosphatase